MYWSKILTNATPRICCFSRGTRTFSNQWLGQSLSSATEIITNALQETKFIVKKVLTEAARAHILNQGLGSPFRQGLIHLNHPRRLPPEPPRGMAETQAAAACAAVDQQLFIS